MTVSTTTAKVSYLGDGTSVAFAVPFVFFAASELEVIERVIATGAETVRVPSTHYTVAGGNGATGTVTAVAAPPATVRWTIRRTTARTQLVDYQTGDAFPAETHERALDRLTAQVQELEEVLQRNLRVSVTETNALQELPTVAQRASQYLAFDAAGNPIAAAAAPGTVTVSAYMQTVLDDATAAAARTTLGAAAAGSATTTAEGLIELATQAEANTGTDAVRALTPATLASISPLSVTLDAVNDQALILDASDANKLKRALLTPTLIQRAYDEERVYSSNTSYTAIPSDDTKPEITEGVEILSVTITPKSASSRIRARAVVPYGPNVGLTMTASIHRGGQALATSWQYANAGQWSMTNTVEVEEASPGTSSVTYSVRVGAVTIAAGFEIGSWGAVGSRRLGGAACASLVVEEIAP